MYFTYFPLIDEELKEHMDWYKKVTFLGGFGTKKMKFELQIVKHDRTYICSQDTLYPTDMQPRVGFMYIPYKIMYSRTYYLLPGHIISHSYLVSVDFMYAPYRLMCSCVWLMHDLHHEARLHTIRIMVSLGFFYKYLVNRCWPSTCAPIVVRALCLVRERALRDFLGIKKRIKRMIVSSLIWRLLCIKRCFRF